jgi:hypothetical protein
MSKINEIIDGKKKCPKCLNYKTLCDFLEYKAKNKKGEIRYHSWCYECERPLRRAATSRYDKTNKGRAVLKKYYATNKGKINILRKSLKKAKKDSTREKIIIKINYLLKSNL